MHAPVRFSRVVLCCSLAACAVRAGAAPPAADWVAVEPGVLAQTRGGFTTGTGLQLSLGIERTVSVNGELVAHSNFAIAGVDAPGAGQLAQTRAALSSVKLVQNGTGNIYQAALSAQTLGGIVIQNSLSDQQISSTTVINASANSASLLTALNFNGSLADALARAAGSP
ncbi:MAG: hypothetical protein V4857_10970 [Pseudomonadota bacterium]